MNPMQEFGELLSGILNGSVLFCYRLFDEHRLRKRQKEILRKCLTRGEWKWRTFKSLCRAIQEDAPTTKGLLIELGAQHNTGKDDLWTLIEH